jgi:hypothetical protein
MDMPRFQRALRTLGDVEGTTICDMGSYPGYGLWAFKACRRYVGVGKCPNWYRDVLTDRFGVEWFDCDFENPVGFAALSCRPDIVVLQEVLEHIRRPKAFLTAIHAWMQRGARLYLTTNNLHYAGYILKLAAEKEIFDSATTEDSVYPGHCTYYSLTGLGRVLEDLGFAVLFADRVNFLPESRYYRKRVFAVAKNALIRSVPRRYATHLEILCERR